MKKPVVLITGGLTGIGRAAAVAFANIATEHPKSQLVDVFPGAGCGVPTIVGHYLIQSVPITAGTPRRFASLSPDTVMNTACLC